MPEKVIALIDYSERRLVNQSFGYGFSALMAIVVIWRLAGEHLDLLLGCIYFFLFMLSAYHLMNFFTIRRQSRDVRKKLREAPGDIVWVYRVEKEVMPFGVMVFKKAHYCLGLSNGDSLIFPLMEEIVHPFYREMSTYLPHATFGHSVDNEQLFRVDPEMLRR